MNTAHKDRIRFAVVVPAYNEAESLEELVSRIGDVFGSIGYSGEFEVVVINDGSTDDTENTVANLKRKYTWLRAVHLRRNSGKSLALMVGFRDTNAEIVITMDADLQDRPEDIPLFLAKLAEGFDLVSGWRVSRQETLVRKVGSRIYNAVTKLSSGLKVHDMNCGFKAYAGATVRNIVVFGQYHRYLPLLAHLAGYRVGEVAIGNDNRRHGFSKFRSFRYQGLFDLLSLLFLHRFGLNPLHFFGPLGFGITAIGLLVLTYFVGSEFLFWFGFGDQFRVQDRPLLSFSLTAVLLGLIVFLVGFICDFFLHHQIRDNIDHIIRLNVRTDDDRTPPAR
ncbi:glycosyltransferase family 2 protein [Bradyrhizobium sp. AUGA SZCCT0222]|uniref:glycosyltransferase family 2 protein n=1 Tax=Bradyrhizobium sp. AUGA SZCCT0222 TaxID=2807668 RepID=UPI001BA68A6F|nr:glycosyltransferase family 2 protein [Bradyrhizobium sp. AUGA SZCCT0222]MBR1270658.1 glycosyltransferase family 2 protein [Bradyrhizobium sp. AUGA SZCCT0222]